VNKLIGSAREACADIPDGATLLAGGFGLCGIPEMSIRALRVLGTKNLTVVSNNCGVDDFGLGILLRNKQIVKMISSYVGENKEFERQYLAGELEVELNPQGTLAERIRAGGAGLGGFFTPTGAGTQIAQGKESRVIEGKEMIFEKPLKADFAIVRAWKGDKWGNLTFRKTARNFSPMMCTAARIAIAEVEHLVEVGELEGDQIQVPSVYVKRIFQGSNYQKWIEKRTVRAA
jgi:3-oxoacid CoA-transferase subunit A